MSAAAESVMRVLCAWCHGDMGVQPCAPSQAHLVSHGMCTSCYSAAFGEPFSEAPSFAPPVVRAPKAAKPSDSLEARVAKLEQQLAQMREYVTFNAV